MAGNPDGVLARSMHDPRADDFAQTRTSVILDYGDRLRSLMSINHNHQNGRKFQSAWFRFEGTDGTMMVKLGVCYDYPNGEADELWFLPERGELGTDSVGRKLVYRCIYGPYAQPPEIR